MYHVMLCYVMLCYVMLCYVMLCYVMLCYVMLCYVMLCYVMLCYVMLCCVVLCCVVLCCVVLCCVMLCYVIQVLHCTVLSDSIGKISVSYEKNRNVIEVVNPSERTGECRRESLCHQSRKSFNFGFTTTSSTDVGK